LGSAKNDLVPEAGPSRRTTSMRRQPLPANSRHPLADIATTSADRIAPTSICGACWPPRGHSAAPDEDRQRETEQQKGRDAPGAGAQQ
jgi:hypothetical protein